MTVAVPAKAHLYTSQTRSTSRVLAIFSPNHHRIFGRAGWDGNRLKTNLERLGGQARWAARKAGTTVTLRTDNSFAHQPSVAGAGGNLYAILAPAIAASLFLSGYRRYCSAGKGRDKRFTANRWFRWLSSKIC